MGSSPDRLPVRWFDDGVTPSRLLKVENLQSGLQVLVVDILPFEVEMVAGCRNL